MPAIVTNPSRKSVGTVGAGSGSAANTFVRETPQGTQEFYVGIEAVGVVACLAIVVWRRNLLLGLVVGLGVVAVVRAMT